MKAIKVFVLPSVVEKGRFDICTYRETLEYGLELEEIRDMESNKEIEILNNLEVR
ncbi:MAG: hypothetical protein ACRDD8_15550 [Bacteroidales bacterium]